MSCSNEQRWLAAFVAVGLVLLGVVCFISIASVVIAIWQSGFVMVALWTATFAAFFYASRFLYRLILRNEWI